MTGRKGEITTKQIKRDWPHHVAMPAEAVRGPQNSIPIYAAAKDLWAGPMPYHLTRAGAEMLVFCFKTAEGARAFAERFGGEVLPVIERSER
jgi:hypothetical protein